MIIKHIMNLDKDSVIGFVVELLEQLEINYGIDTETQNIILNRITK